VTAVVLALGSAALFGGMTVAIRLGLGGGKAASASLAMLLWACGVAAVAALPRHDLDGTWPFLLAGMLAPGCSQVLFTLSVREAGPSRTSVTVGAAPLVAVAIALAFLDEPLRIALVVGAVAIVAGGLALAGERGRPEHVRVAALLFAVGATVLFAVRDNVVRALHTHASPESAVLATLLAGAIVSLAWARRAPTRSELRRLAPAGILFGLSYVCLYEAYFRGPVSVVSALVATESLWGVGLSALVLGRSERVGRRLALGAVLVVSGGALIGVTR
jgi:drug/metabolite transporter (DMT)-like permease